MKLGRSITVLKEGLYILLLFTSSLPVMASIFRTPALLSHPFPISLSVIDAYIYALATDNDSVREFSRSSLHKSLDVSAPQLCSAEQLTHLSPMMIQTVCLPITYKSDAKCKDKKGCLSVEINPSVMQSKKHERILLSVLQDPCKGIPRLNGERDEHWPGFYHSIRQARKILACQDGQLPYEVVNIHFGREVEKVVIKRS